MQKRRFSILTAIVIGFTLVLSAQAADAAVSKKNKNTPVAGIGVGKKKKTNPSVTVPNNPLTPIPEVPAAVPVGAAILLAAGASQLLRRRQTVS